MYMWNAGKLLHPFFCVCHNSASETNKPPACYSVFFLGCSEMRLIWCMVVFQQKWNRFLSKYTSFLKLLHSTSCLLEASWCPNEPDPNSSLVALTDDCFHFLWKRLFHTQAIHYQSLLAHGKLLSGPDLTAWKSLKFIEGESCSSEVLQHVCHNFIACINKVILGLYCWIITVLQFTLNVSIQHIQNTESII